MKKFTLTKSEQIRIWNEARDAAGPRYTKEINVELPIKELFEGIARTDNIFEEIEQLRVKLFDAFKSVNYKKASGYKDKIIRNNLIRIQILGSQLIKIVNLFGKDRTKNLDLGGVCREANRISKYFLPIEKVVWELERKEDEEQRLKAREDKREYFGHTSSEKLKELKSLEYDLNKFQRAINEISHFAKSYKAKLVNEPFLLILGQAGMGKTHLVCDITKDRIYRKLAPTILVLGEKLLDINNSLKSIFQASSLDGDVNSILKGLNDVGKKKKSRALIIVDAINEADRNGWKSGVRNLIKQVEKYPWVGVVMTCRVPFQFLSLPKRFKIITEYHHGFADYELEAMSAFFNFYNIPLPEVPLLISEFSSPLFLSCFCKTAKDIKGGKAKVAKGIRDLALGQVGMTKILEDFYITKEGQIVKKYSSKFSLLVKKLCIWNKYGNNCLVKMMAKQMAIHGRQYLDNNEVLIILKQLSNNKYQGKTCLKILNILIEEGVVIKDAAWDNQRKQYFDVIKFSFHKFSDHIIARYLLANYFNRDKVKESLTGPTALGELFRDQQSIISNIDLIEALMVEFPERIKKNKKLKERDLIDFLPNDVKVLPQVQSAFIESLYWRKPENFLNDKKVIKKSVIDYINNTLLRYEESSRNFLDFFVSTATKPFHPLNAKRLSNYLSGFSLQNRDLFWSEYLRKQFGSGSIYKLISWIENQNLEKITADQAWCVVTVLGWVLTTNVRLLRDRATRCIFIIGIIHPDICFKRAIKLSETNDPYITERMLSASYGVAMSLHNNKSNSNFLKILYPFAKKVYSYFFKKRPSYGTTNILIRDYARGIIEVAMLHNKNLFSNNQINRIRPLYKDGGLRQWGRSQDKNKGEYRDGNSPLGMDFENYTLGHLVPDRNNYDYANKDFIRIKENILWRIYQLGYSLDKYGVIDKNIVSNTRIDRGSNYAGKVDRYGKKYCWIAYHELLGLKMDRKEYSRDWVSEDGRSSELDIDPSFPECLRIKDTPFNHTNLIGGPREIKKWMVQTIPPNISAYKKLENINEIKGPWVLAHGTIGQKRVKSKRKITTFITGLLIDKKDKDKIKKYLKSLKFPGNDHIPNLPETSGVFAGELGWREQLIKENKLYINIKRGEKKVKLSKREKQFHSISILYYNSKIIKKSQKPPEYKMEPIYEKIPVEPLARWFHDKDYAHLSSDDNSVGLYIPSGKFIKINHLHTGISSFSFIDRSNHVASLSFFRGDKFGTHENLLYLRKDILDKYLKRLEKELVLIAWGERQYWPEGGFERRKDLSPIYEKYQNIYKEIIEYNNYKA